jgi:hypothetical protein
LEFANVWILLYAGVPDLSSLDFVSRMDYQSVGQRAGLGKPIYKIDKAGIS